VELHPQREQVLVVDEVDQAVAAVQVLQEAELAGRVPQGDEVFEERDLHGRVVEQHPPVPAESGLPFEEARGHRRVRTRRVVVLRHGDRHGQIRGTETDPHDIEFRFRHVRPLANGPMWARISVSLT